MQDKQNEQNTGSRNAAGAITPGNANQIQAIVAPRVLRFGIRMNW